MLTALAAPLTLLVSTLVSAPIAGMSDDQLDQQLASVAQHPIGDRIDALSALFVGTPYVEQPLGEGGTGPEPQARWRLDGVDCQTFVETVLALANAKSTAHAKALLDDIRYSQEPFTFAHRNHFTEAQWLPSNLQKGYLSDEVIGLDGRAPSADLVLKRAKWSQVPGLERLKEADIPEGKFTIRYLTPAGLRAHVANIETGTVILVVRAADPKRVVRVSHMGFVLRGPHGIFVRHATSGPEHKVIDEGLGAYLLRMQSFKKWPVVGFGLAQPLDAKFRASQIHAQ